MMTNPPALSASAALFLDFDGTLAPLAPRPQDVRVPAWVVPTLFQLKTRLGGALAIVSGRPIAQLDEFLSPFHPIAAGAHGAELRDASGHIERQVAVPPSAVVDRARALVVTHPGLLFELKPSGFSVHYRSRPELADTCGDALLAALAAEPNASFWQLLHGHCVFELKQRAVSKGSAVQALLTNAAFARRQPVFVGDDLTDEDGVRVVQEAGGFGVRVGPGDTQARYRLADVEAVGAWLRAELL